MSDTEFESAEQGSRDALCALILAARKHAPIDPAAALVKARQVAEVICHLEYRKARIKDPSLGDSTRLMLDQLIGKLRPHLPARLILQLKILQLYGNEGAHPGKDHTPPDAEFIYPCLIALAQAATSYFVEVLCVAIPPELEGKLDFASVHPRHAEDLTIKIARGNTTTVPYRLCETFGDLLDAVWIGLDPIPKAFTYGATWVLRNQAGTELRHARAFIGAKDGLPIPDNRRLEEVGIRPGDYLTVVWL